MKKRTSIEGEDILFKNSKIPHIEMLPLIILSFILYKLISNIGPVAKMISPVTGMFIWAFCIAYILNPIMVKTEKKFKLKRVWSLLITYVIFIGVIILLVTIIAPKIGKSVSDLVSSIPEYRDVAQEWIEHNSSKFGWHDKGNINIEQKSKELMDNISRFATKGLNTALSKLVGVTFSLVKGIFTIIVSVYVLKDKEKFKNTLTRLVYALSDKKRADKIIGAFSEINSIFSKFILGKSLDSLIIGILCYIGLKILRIEFALLLSLVVGITNMIPYFGPFLGMIPAFIITLFYSPIKALWVIIYIFLLQQFDGWYLGPKILGNHVGLSPFWVMVAILIGGKVYGVLGMFLGVPIAATVKIFMNKFIDRRLSEKGIEV